MPENNEHTGDEKPSAQPDADALYQRALASTRQCITAIANDVLFGSRLPAPDALGVLADDQIRPHHFAEIQRIAAEYPGIDAIYAHATYRDENAGRPYVEFDVRLEPFSRKLQYAHWTVADRIKQLFRNNKFSFSFLPARDQREFGATVLLYKKPQQSAK